MSIKHSLTPHGTIRIECGGEWIEVQLGAGGGGIVASGGQPLDVSDAPIRSGPSTLPGTSPNPGNDPEPQVGPGVMSFIVGNRFPPMRPFRFYGMAEKFHRLSLSGTELPDWEKLGANIREQALVWPSYPELSVRVLEVNVGDSSQFSLSRLAQLRNALNASELNVDVVRLWQAGKAEE